MRRALELARCATFLLLCVQVNGQHGHRQRHDREEEALHGYHHHYLPTTVAIPTTTVPTTRAMRLLASHVKGKGALVAKSHQNALASARSTTAPDVFSNTTEAPATTMQMATEKTNPKQDSAIAKTFVRVTTTTKPPSNSAVRILIRKVNKVTTTTKPPIKKPARKATTTTATPTTPSKKIDCILHPSKCKKNPPRKDAAGNVTSNSLPQELKHITWGQYIDKSTLKLPQLEKSIQLSSERTYDLAFGSPDIAFHECPLPGDAYTLAGRCRFLQHCARPEIISSLETFLSYSCVIGNKEKKDADILGVCCPSDSIPVAAKPVTPRPSNITTPKTNATKPQSCGMMPLQSGRIVGGQKSEKGKWPWMAALLRDRNDQYCGGSIIDDRHILTASHCVDGFTPGQVTVRLGEYDFGEKNSSTRHDIAVAHIFMHERYDPVTYLNDVAVLRLKERIEFSEHIKPICVPDTLHNVTLDGKSAYVAGWGLMSERDRAGSQVMMEVVVPIWKVDECRRAYDDLQLPIVAEQICAGYLEGGKDSCSGDSGGPLMYQSSPGQWSVVGVVSWGVGCAEKGRPGVYARVTSYIDWINRKRH